MAEAEGKPGRGDGLVAAWARTVDVAAARVRGHVRATPVQRSPMLEAQTGAEVWLKLENVQITGSFKARGASNAILALEPAARRRGVVAASSGNHGMAVAYALTQMGVDGTIFVPAGAADTKVAAIRAYGATVHRGGDDCVEAEARARQHAAATGGVYISPYNDPLVVAGQGTVGRELAWQAPPLDAVFVALGGGGLIAGTAAALKARHPGIEVVACSASVDAAMHASIEAGRVVAVQGRPTLSDGTAGNLEPDTITFDLCRRLVDRSVLVTETEIEQVLRRFIGDHHLLVEGAAAMAVAGFLRVAEGYVGKRVGIVLCGANIGLDTLRRIL